MIADLGPTGFILGPGCEFPQNGAIINAKAMVDASKEARRHEGRAAAALVTDSAAVIQ